MNKFYKRYVLRSPDDGVEGGGGSNNVTPPKLPTETGERTVTRYELELRDEAAKNRVARLAAEDREKVVAGQAKELADRLAALEAKLAGTSTEVETKIAETRKQLEEEFKTRTFKAQVKAAVADKLLDVDEIDNLDLSTITYDEKGNLAGVDVFLDKLRVKRPYVFADYHAAPNSTAARANRQIPPANGVPAVDATKLSKADYDKAKKKYLSGG